MWYRPTFGLVVVGAVVAGAVVACKKDSTAPCVPKDLSGSWALLGLTEPPNPPIGPPSATGTLNLSATRYKVHIDITIPSPTTVDDSGAYHVTCTAIDETSDNVSNGQATGSYTLSHDTLTVNVTSQAVNVITVWKKQ